MEGLSRICVKIYADEPRGIDDAAVYVPIFHEWIRDQPFDLVLFDVADYAHVPDGPGIVLVAHEAHFAVDRSDGSFGLLAQRRVPASGTPVEAMARTIRHALQIAGKLERERRLRGRLKFQPSRLRIEINDRLRGPNTSEAYEAIAPLVRDAVVAVCGDRNVQVSRVDNDPRDRLALDVVIDGAASVEQLIAA